MTAPAPRPIRRAIAVADALLFLTVLVPQG